MRQDSGKYNAAVIKMTTGYRKVGGKVEKQRKVKRKKAEKGRKGRARQCKGKVRKERVREGKSG